VRGQGGGQGGARKKQREIHVFGALGKTRAAMALEPIVSMQAGGM